MQQVSLCSGDSITIVLWCYKPQLLGKNCYVKIVLMFFLNLKRELDITDRRGAENWDTVDQIKIDRLEGPHSFTLCQRNLKMGFQFENESIFSVHATSEKN